MSRGSLIAKASYHEGMLVINDLNQNENLRKLLLNWFECMGLSPFQKSLDRTKIDIYNDKIGVSKQTGLFANYAYRISLIMVFYRLG